MHNIPLLVYVYKTYLWYEPYAVCILLLLVWSSYFGFNSVYIAICSCISMLHGACCWY